MSDDDLMVGPGSHENSALNALADGRAEDAQVLAILSLASAVNRLAASQEALAEDR
ncbi:hypothetical protein [Actinomadura sp. 6N118]|uniref:hypothetical protein n=1 Tax=Actinomadura sp. 6N118 TaxID=3375151 RepID=UPI0037980A92